MKEEINYKHYISSSIQFFRNFKEMNAKYVNIYRSNFENDTILRKNNGYYNILWSVIQTLSPSIYQRAPSAYISNKFHDDDEVATTAGEIIERVVDYCIFSCYSNFDSSIRSAVQSNLVGGMGLLWVRYDPKFYIDNDGVEKKDDFIAVDHVDISDFLCSPCTRWENVSWVARRVHMSKEDFKDRFGKNASDIVGDNGTYQRMLIAGESMSSIDKNIYKNTIGVWELWDKRERKVCFLCDGSYETIEVLDDFLGLDNFFPCPKPFMATTTSNTFIPVPDYKQYEPLAIQINILTKQLEGFIKAYRLRGIYNKACEGISDILNSEEQGIILWASGAENFKQDGANLMNSIQLLPLDPIERGLQVCLQTRDSLLQEFDRFYGISDIIRGSSDASETATAQNIKAQYASVRLKAKQDGCFSLTRGAVEIMGEIAVKFFSPNSIFQISNFAYEQSFLDAEEQQKGSGVMMFKEAVTFMKEQHNRRYRIDIETDSTMEATEESDQQKATNFVNMVMTFLGQISQMPSEMFPLLSEIFMASIRRYRLGRSFEQTMKSQLDTMIQSAKEKEEQSQQMQQQQQQQAPIVMLEKEKNIGKLQVEAYRILIKQMEIRAEQAQPMTPEEISQEINAINAIDPQNQMQPMKFAQLPQGNISPQQMQFMQHQQQKAVNQQ